MHTHTCTYTTHTLSQGSVVEARVTDGTVYEGILTACSPKLELFLEEVHDKAKVNSATVLPVKTDSLTLSLSLSLSLSLCPYSRPLGTMLKERGALVGQK